MIGYRETWVGRVAADPCPVQVSTLGTVSWHQAKGKDRRVKVTIVNVNYSVLCHYRVSKWVLDPLQVPGYSNEQRIEVAALRDIQIR